jgi:hypothetical protein
METEINDWNQDVSIKIYNTNQLQNKTKTNFINLRKILPANSVPT